MRKMKDSGIDWIGEIPEEWEVRRIKTISTCRENKLADNSGTDYFALENIVSWNGSYIHTDSIYDTTGAIICKTGDIAFGKLRPYLAKVFQIEHDRCCSSEFAVFGDFLGFSRYYFYIMLTNGFVNSVDLSTYGVKMPRANIDYIKNMFVPIPSYNEQQHISGYLDRQCTHIDNIIEKTKTSIEEYKKLKQAVITQAVTKGIRGNREMKDSGIDWIGEIPVEWEITPFRHVLIERNEKNIPIRTEERLSLSIDLGVTLYSEKTTNLDRFKDDFEQYKLAHEGDLVMNSMNMIVGASGVSKYYGCVSPVYYTFYDNLPDHTTAKYCEYIFRSKTMLRVLYSLGKGIYAIVRGDDRVNTCRLKVSKEDLKSLSIPNPSVDEQREIINYLDQKCSEIDAIITKKQQFITEMENYKKSLIFECVTGKREVSV